MAYERKNIQLVEAYVPGEQPADTTIIKLNTNENPYPPSPAVQQALDTFTVDQLRRYVSMAAVWRVDEAEAQLVVVGVAGATSCRCSSNRETQGN